jgi:hypothetical protein
VLLVLVFLGVSFLLHVSECSLYSSAMGAHLFEASCPAADPAQDSMSGTYSGPHLSTSLSTALPWMLSRKPSSFWSL